MNKVIFTLSIIVCVVIGIVAVKSFNQPENPISTNNEQQFRVIDQGSYRQFVPAKTINPFVLNQKSGEFTNEALKGKWTFVIFGYTYCPDVCPTTLTRVKSVLSSLEEIGDVQIAFVSADPLRDSVDRLFQYVNYFDNRFLGLTADHNRLFGFAQNLYLPYGIVSTTRDDNYAVSHSASIALINPQGKYTVQFKPKYIAGEVPTVDMKQMALSFKKIVGEHNQ